MTRTLASHVVECRYAGKVLDEVVARNCDVHLEQMSNNYYALIIDTPTQRVCIHIGAKDERGHAFATVLWHEPINRRSEAQHRRWNALTPAQRNRRKR